MAPWAACSVSTGKARAGLLKLQSLSITSPLPFPAGGWGKGERPYPHQWSLSAGPHAQRPCPGPKSRGLCLLQGTLRQTDMLYPSSLRTPSSSLTAVLNRRDFTITSAEWVISTPGGGGIPTPTQRSLSSLTLEPVRLVLGSLALWRPQSHRRSI